MKSDPLAGIGARNVLGFDPNAVLAREPGILLDPNFLAAIHAELEAELGAEKAANALLQIGFLQGMTDAERAGGASFAAVGEDAEPLTPALAIHASFNTDPDPTGALELSGEWPEGREAKARLSRDPASTATACLLSAGYTSGWLSGTLDAEILAVETSCRGSGDSACRFIAREAEVWRSGGDPEIVAMLDALPVATLRALARPDYELVDPTAHIDQDATAVNIWGPVMVIPFSGAEEALIALDLVGRDPAAGDVSVVIVDLSGAIVDEAFGAVALEQIVDTVEAWGAETIFAEVSALSEGVVAGLERQPLLIHKQLPQAIAAAFQVAEAQRRLV
jgi:hypothetical protein